MCSIGESFKLFLFFFKIYLNLWVGILKKFVNVLFLVNFLVVNCLLWLVKLLSEFVEVLFKVILLVVLWGMLLFKCMKFFIVLCVVNFFNNIVLWSFWFVVMVLRINFLFIFYNFRYLFFLVKLEGLRLYFFFNVFMFSIFILLIFVLGKFVVILWKILCKLIKFGLLVINFLFVKYEFKFI